MRIVWALLLLAGLVTLLTGCGDSGEKGINKDKDRPKVTDRAGQ